MISRTRGELSHNKTYFMKNAGFQKKFLILCLFIISLQFFSLSCLVLVPMAQAQDGGFEAMPARINVSILGLPTEPCKDNPAQTCVVSSVYSAPCKCTDLQRADKGEEYCKRYETKTCIEIPWISQYINAVYRYGVVIGSVIAVLSLMAGGLMYVLGGFNQTMLGKGKEMMTGAVMGLLLLLGSYMILNLINPNLVRMKPITVEVNKQVMSAPSSCSDILNDAELKANIDIEGYKEPNCGESFNVKLKAGSAVQLGENSKCTGMICENGKACMEKKDAPGKYECINALVFGKIVFAENFMQKVLKTNLGLEAVVDSVSLHGFDAFKLEDKVMGIPHFDSGTKSYAIKTDVDLEFKQDINYLKIDVNDKAPGFTIDESYRLGLDQKVTDANKTGVFHAVPVAIEGSDCCTYKCKGEGTWELSPGCNWLDKKYLSTGNFKQTLNVEINTNDFYCGKTPLGESISAATKNAYSHSDCFGINKGKKIGENCGKNSDCTTNDCECEKTEISGTICKCECNSDEECVAQYGAGEKASTRCNTSLATFNECLQCAPVGGECVKDDECCSQACNEGLKKCECKNNDDCTKHLTPGTTEFANQLKKKDKAIYSVKCSDNTDQCTFCKATGFDCNNDDDCCSSDCVNNKCSCDVLTNAGCAKTEYCNKIPGSYNVCMMLKPVLAKCSENIECQSGDCETDQWYGKTTKYEKDHPTEGGTQSRCECTADAHCPQGETCHKVEDGCGWNYCAPASQDVATVHLDYGSPWDKGLNVWIDKLNKIFEVQDYDKMYKGLCLKDTDCKATAGSAPDCVLDWGWNKCDACAATEPKAGSICPNMKPLACGSGMFCTDRWSMVAPICAKQTTKFCSTDNDCVGEGWKLGNCDDSFCDCTDDNDCSDGFICANNSSGETGGVDQCIPNSFSD